MMVQQQAAQQQAPLAAATQKQQQQQQQQQQWQDQGAAGRGLTQLQMMQQQQQWQQQKLAAQASSLAQPAGAFPPTLPPVDPRSFISDQQMQGVLDTNGALLREAYDLVSMGGNGAGGRSLEQEARLAELRATLRKRFGAMETLAQAVGRPLSVPKEAVRTLFPLDPSAAQVLPSLPPYMAALIYRDVFLQARADLLMKREQQQQQQKLEVQRLQQALQQEAARKAQDLEQQLRRVEEEASHAL